MSNENLPETLRRGAEYWMDIHAKCHPGQHVCPSGYMEAMREAADEIERLTALAQNGQSAIDTNQRLAQKLEWVAKERDFARAERDTVSRRVVELEQLVRADKQACCWVRPEDKLPESGDAVLALVNGSPRENVGLFMAYQIAHFYDDDGWVIDEWPDWEGAEVVFWTPLPEPPGEDK